MTEHDAHPDEGTIHAWLDRQLDDTSAATLEAHLQRCDECAERVAEARGLIAGTSRILSSLDVDPSSASGTPAVEAWRPVALPPEQARRMRSFRLTPARSAIAAVLVVAVATAIVRENQQPASKLASIAAESAAVVNAPAPNAPAPNAPAPNAPAPNAPAPNAPMSNAPMSNAPMSNAPVANAPAPGIMPAPPAVARLDTTAGARVAAARTFARAQRETTVNTDLARVAQVPAPAASTPTEQVIAAAPQRVNAGIEAPQCYRVESATGTAAAWGPVALPLVLVLDHPATSNAARVLTSARTDADAGAVFERRGEDSLLFTLRRLGFTGTLAVGPPGDVRAGVMRSAPATMNLEAVVTTATGASGDERRALRKSPSAAGARADSQPKAPERDAAPAVPVVVRRVECRR